MPLPESSRPVAEVLAELEAMRSSDVRWRDGRAFSLAYSAGPEVHEVADEAYRRFSGDNALNTDAFPSLRRMQAEVVSIVADWVGAGPDAAGFMTSGGTESILMAVKAARERGRAERARTSCCRRVRMLRSRRPATTSAWKAVGCLFALTGGPTPRR